MSNSYPERLTKMWRVIVTCEHGGNVVPAHFAWLFEGAQDVLTSHRGWDAGALVFARTLAELLSAPLYCTTVSRLLVDANRSTTNHRVFSEWSRRLSSVARQDLLASQYYPHRAAIIDAVRHFSEAAGVVHLAIHSFTPVLAGKVRRADLGILYDPARRIERKFCADLKDYLEGVFPTLTILRNSPYLGKTDGLPAAVRKMFPQERYVGVEIELNQRLLDATGTPPGEIVDALAAAVRQGMDVLSVSGWAG